MQVSWHRKGKRCGAASAPTQIFSTCMLLVGALQEAWRAKPVKPGAPGNCSGNCMRRARAGACSSRPFGQTTTAKMRVRIRGAFHCCAFGYAYVSYSGVRFTVVNILHAGNFIVFGPSLGHQSHQSRRYALLSHMLLDLADRHLLPMKNACRQRRRRLGMCKHIRKVHRRPGPAAGNHRNLDRTAHRLHQLQIKTLVTYTLAMATLNTTMQLWSPWSPQTTPPPSSTP